MLPLYRGNGGVSPTLRGIIGDLGYVFFDWQTAIWELDEGENTISENLGVER